MTITVSKIGDTADLLGESPIWDSENKCLYWVDSVNCLIKRYDPKVKQYQSWKTPSQIGCIGLAPNNSLIVSLADGFYALNLESGEINTLMQPIPPNEKVRFNDGKIDRFGNFICGSMGIHAEPLGELYRMNRVGESKKLANGIRISNCIAFSPDGKVMYMADSLDLKIRAYDYGDGNQDLLEPRIFFDTSGLGSGPDGATVDAEGYLWVALISALY
ncbi:SMP-30/gluconolactonase/LRE family protein [Acinetobacter gerneri]|uniref:SMP-30/gluconolactonase/LRE family protein n=1 Tax=Acinetobacter gerneri TaxID=202952 RepID=UPI003AF6FF3A